MWTDSKVLALQQGFFGSSVFIIPSPATCPLAPSPPPESCAGKHSALRMQCPASLQPILSPSLFVSPPFTSSRRATPASTCRPSRTSSCRCGGMGWGSAGGGVGGATVKRQIGKRGGVGWGAVGWPGVGTGIRGRCCWCGMARPCIGSGHGAGASMLSRLQVGATAR